MLVQCWLCRDYYSADKIDCTVNIEVFLKLMYHCHGHFNNCPTVILTTSHVFLSTSHHHFDNYPTFIFTTSHSHFDDFSLSFWCHFDNCPLWFGRNYPTVQWSYICIRWYTVTNFLHHIIILPAGQCENWWLGPLDDIFGSSLTSAKPSLLRSELETCQELLQLEPENKCEQPSHA